MTYQFAKPINLSSLYGNGLMRSELSALELLEGSLYALQPRDISKEVMDKLIAAGYATRLVRTDKRSNPKHTRLCFITIKGRAQMADMRLSQYSKTKRESV